MAIKIQVNIAGVTGKLRTLPARTQTNLRNAVAQKTIELEARVKANIADLFRSTGPLYQGVRSSITEEPGSAIGTVFTTGVPYAAAQEYGGTWMIPEIFPVNAKVLAFMSPGKMGFSSGGGSNGVIFAMHTKAHLVTLPARSYARRALFDMRNEIVTAITGAVQESTNGR